MLSVSVLTLVRDRQAHLDQLIAGVSRSSVAPDEIVIVDMSDRPLEIRGAQAPTRHLTLSGADLPLAGARNLAAHEASGDILLFLDVDCIVSAALIGRLAERLARTDAVVCPEALYLPAQDAPYPAADAALRALAEPHPVRPFPPSGERLESNPGLFWSLAFALRRETFQRLGGFDPAYVGYGAEDTDFGFQVARAGLPLIFLGGHPVFHQHHDGCDPPLQHFDALTVNARHFRAKWGRWPMEGWLEAMRRLGLIRWTGETLEVLRQPTETEILRARKPANARF
ncbi:glycosyltransferase family 2 protein [Brevundimonas lutea]|uniref:glycosyltransferase family 2 protein n=1 Tax=Brevundimonas lutea TaxID=2293980 RepID=UPI000F044323|nr:glycosyltransferase [Brevundimonas lutea]